MHSKRRLPAVLAGLIASVLAISAPAHAQQVPPDIIIAGSADFMTYCAACHGRKGIGDGPVAKHLTTTPANLTMLKKNNGGKFPEDVAHMIIDGRKEVMGHGTRDMPIWGNWFKFVARAVDVEGTDNETAEIIVALRIQGLIEYMKTIQQE